MGVGPFFGEMWAHKATLLRFHLVLLTVNTFWPMKWKWLNPCPVWAYLEASKDHCLLHDPVGECVSEMGHQSMKEPRPSSSAVGSLTPNSLLKWGREWCFGSLAAQCTSLILALPNSRHSWWSFWNKKWSQPETYHLSKTDWQSVHFLNSNYGGGN